MTDVVCDSCDSPFSAESLDTVTKHPVTSEALCPSCSEVECQVCQRNLSLEDLTKDHKHQSDGWVCDTCPRVEFPFEFTETFRREPEGYVPSYIDAIYPNVQLGNDYNADAIPRTFWRLSASVTFRITSGCGMEVVAVDGEYIDGKEPLS